MININKNKINNILNNKIEDDINKQIRDYFIKYINNEFINKIKRFMKKINLDDKNNNYYIKLDLMKKYLISRIDYEYCKNIKKKLLKFIKENNNVNVKQINYIINNFIEIYYPYIREQYINYIKSL